MPAAIGDEADVPVCEAVHLPWRSVVITFLSPCLLLPELYVVARVELHCSEYQGMLPFSLALLILTVKILVA